MTTTLDHLSATPEQEGTTWPRTLRAEWLKFSTLRSSWLLLGAAVTAMLVFGAVIGYNTRRPAGLDPNDVAPSGVLQGYYLAQLLMVALGVLFVSGEYGTGSIRSTFAAVPRRLPVVTAKATVVAGSVLCAMVPASLLAFLIGQSVISHYRPAFSLSTPGALRAALGTALYLTAIALIGSALGWLARSTAGGLVAAAALVFVLPVVFGTLLGHRGQQLAAYLPDGAGGAFASTAPEAGSLSPAHGALVLLVWVVVGLVGASLVLRSRDA